MQIIEAHSISHLQPLVTLGYHSSYSGSFAVLKTSIWLSVDPLADEYPSHSPYNYTLNNPIMLIDPNGMNTTVYITGSSAGKATEQLNQSTSLTITRNPRNGKLSAEGEAITKDDKQLLAAINDQSVHVNIKATNSTTTSTGVTFPGGAFMGNDVIENNESVVDNNKPYSTLEFSSNRVIANQEVNPSILSQIDSHYGAITGTSMLHETTEAYMGGVFSLKSGVSAGSAAMDLPSFEKAHNAATDPAGDVFHRYIDRFGNTWKPGMGKYGIEFYLEQPDGQINSLFKHKY